MRGGTVGIVKILAAPRNFGITCYDLAEFLHQDMNSMSHWAPIVEAMKLAIADQIYEEKYATACDFNELGVGKDCTVFDFGVNSGPSRSIKTAQQIVGVTVDGVLGPITLAAINAYGPVGFINEMAAARLSFLRRLPIWPRFGNGWAARVHDLTNYSLALLQPKGMMQHGPQMKLTRIPLAFAKGWE